MILFTEYLIRTLMNGISSLILMMTAYFILYKWGKYIFSRFKIRYKSASLSQIKRELKNSSYTFLIFGVIAVIIMYMREANYIVLSLELENQSVLNILADFLILFLAHDFYFYWMHRAIHGKKFYKMIHHEHHKSVLTSPFTSFSFHWSEAILESIFLPIFLFIGGEWSGLSLGLFLIVSKVFNIIGHMGYDFFHDRIINLPLLKLLNTSIIHDSHHLYSRYNFGLYTTIWDRLFGTFHQPIRKDAKSNSALDFASF